MKKKIVLLITIFLYCLIAKASNGNDIIFGLSFAFVILIIVLIIKIFVYTFQNLNGVFFKFKGKVFINSIKFDKHAQVDPNLDKRSFKPNCYNLNKETILNIFPKEMKSRDINATDYLIDISFHTTSYQTQKITGFYGTMGTNYLTHCRLNITHKQKNKVILSKFFKNSNIGVDVNKNNEVSGFEFIRLKNYLKSKIKDNESNEYEIIIKEENNINGKIFIKIKKGESFIGKGVTEGIIPNEYMIEKLFSKDLISRNEDLSDFIFQITWKCLYVGKYGDAGSAYRTDCNIQVINVKESRVILETTIQGDPPPDKIIDTGYKNAEINLGFPIEYLKNYITKNIPGLTQSLLTRQ